MAIDNPQAVRFCNESDDWVRARMRSRVDDSVFDEWVIYPGPRASVARG